MCALCLHVLYVASVGGVVLVVSAESGWKMNDYGFFRDCVEHDDGAEREIKRLESLLAEAGAEIAVVTFERNDLQKALKVAEGERNAYKFVAKGLQDSYYQLLAEKAALVKLLADVQATLETGRPNAAILKRIEDAILASRKLQGD